MQSNCARLKWMELHISHSLPPSQLGREVIFSPPFGITQLQNSWTALLTWGWVCGHFPPAHAHFGRDPPSLRPRFPLSTPTDIRIWWLQDEGFSCRLIFCYDCWASRSVSTSTDLGRVAGPWSQAQNEQQEGKKASHWAVVCSKNGEAAARWAKTGLSRGGQWAEWSSPVSGLFAALPLIHSCLFSHLFWGFFFSFCLILNFPCRRLACSNKAF